MPSNAPTRRGPQHPTGALASAIPDKLYFRIGEVARLCEVPAYVLRFWESEFPQLRPNKGGTGQRLYRRRDVEMALRVKSLLKEEGYTIPGARAVMKSEFRGKDSARGKDNDSPQLSLIDSGPSAAKPASEAKQLRALRREMESIAALLGRPIDALPGVHKSRAAQKPAPLPIRAQRKLTPS
ncbi:MAG TPA: MerR family transcriptional regulator [Acidobacteriaceae bacterium]